MPRTRAKAAASKTSKLSTDDLNYLAGIFEATLNLRGPGTQSAMAISNDEYWPRHMAQTYGGYHEEFQSGKNEKWYWGWYVPLERRLELLNILEESSVCRTFSTEDFERSRFKMEKSINSAKERAQAGATQAKDTQEDEARAARRTRATKDAKERAERTRKEFEG